MASLTARVGLFVARVAAQFNAIKPRLAPIGGAAGAVLQKNSATDNDFSWVPREIRFGFFCQGKPTAAEVFGPFVADAAFTLPNGMSTSIANAGAAYTASGVWTLRRNGTAIGTVTFAAGSASGTVATSTSADVAVARGDRLTLTAPASVDTTGTDIGFTFVGSR